MDNKKKLTVVFDEFDQPYDIKEKIGSGGQGTVFKTNHDNILVKVCTKKKAGRRTWFEHIRWLMTQDLTSLHIAKPIARITKPRVGYVMELMDGLMPLSTLMEEAEITLPDPQTYITQGGIKRRLQLLAKLARTLADLHGKGMAYGDLSPANIFISASTEYSEVWLIDCDNICVNQRMPVDIDYTQGRAGRVHTPSYGAPEIVRGEGLVNSLTDSWSFAVIAFSLLTATHPFLGDDVSDGEPELEEQAFRGELPWIHHPTDDSNSCSNGIPANLVLLPSLMAIFERCFNAGKDNLGQRPGLSEWAEVFEKTAQQLVECQGCHSHYYYRPVDRKLTCDFCDDPINGRNVLLINHYLHDPSIKEIDGAENKDCFIDLGFRQVLNLNNTLTLKSSPPGSTFYPSANGLFDLQLTSDGLEIIPQRKNDLKIKYHDAKTQNLTHPLKLKNADRKNKKVFIISDTGSSIKTVYRIKW